MYNNNRDEQMLANLQVFFIIEHLKEPLYVNNISVTYQSLMQVFMTAVVLHHCLGIHYRLGISNNNVHEQIVSNSITKVSEF